MSRKITIIGAGNVGATIAYTLSLDNIASELVLIDINKEKAQGEVMDIVQGTSFRDPISVISGDYSDAADSDIVIITSGIGRKPGQSRIDLAQTNVNILKDITPRIVSAAPNALYVLVSNPVDVLTYAFHKLSGLPQHRIIGSGTILDTARLRFDLSNHFKIAQKNIHAYVFGEHGASAFIPWSCARVAGCSLDNYQQMLLEQGRVKAPLDQEATLDYVKSSGSQIIEKKGATFYAVSASVKQICTILTSAYDSVATVSSMMQGEYGIEDVCLSTLCILGPDGIRGKAPMKLTDHEAAQLRVSAQGLKDVIAGLSL